MTDSKNHQLGLFLIIKNSEIEIKTFFIIVYFIVCVREENLKKNWE